MKEKKESAGENIKELRKKQDEIKDKFLIIVHTGEGKGKSTAAFGMAMRTIAHGWKAAIVQFMKSPKDYNYGEVKLAEAFDGLDVYTMGEGFTWNTKDRQADIRAAQRAWKKAVETARSGEYRLVVFDEIIYAMHYGFLDEKLVFSFLDEKPPGVHFVLTGRNASGELIARADLVTEMKNIKHPYKEKGLLAQKGIDW